MRYKNTPYDTSKYDFVALVKELLNVHNLEDIHEDHKEQFKVGADSCTSFHTKFYDKYRAGWPKMVELYERFVYQVVYPSMDTLFLYQKFPTFRVHLKGNLAVGAFHNDAQFGHPPGEINYIIPLTNSEGSASVWVESSPGRGDYQAMLLHVGQLIRFNGNELSHGNLVNQTGKTRVSMDFRILPVHLYKEEDSSISITQKTRLREGDYYKRLEL